MTPLTAGAQGFGGLVGLKKPKEAELKRLLPATVNLNQKRIRIDAKGASDGIPKDLIDVLQTKLVTAIQKDSRYIIDTHNPETLLRFTITNYHVDQTTVDQQTNPPSKCTFYIGRLDAAYQALDVNTGAPLDSENLSDEIKVQNSKQSRSIVPFHGRGQTACGTDGMLSANQARDALADGIVLAMARRATPIEQTVVAPVPGGKLEPLSALALSGRWPALLEEAQKADKLPKPEDDAYRTYLIGLAYEALAYNSAHQASELETSMGKDLTSAKGKAAIVQEEKYFTDAESYLDKAAKSFKDAIEAKPGEKEFREPDGRIEEAVKLYATIERHKKEYEEAVAAKAAGNVNSGGGDTGAKSAPAGEPPSPANSPYLRIIGFCQDRTSDIADMIKDHPGELHFEKLLSVDDEIRLKKECGQDGKAILDAIKAQVNGRKPAGK